MLGFRYLQALPIYLDKIFHPFVAVLLSVTFVLAFGEVESISVIDRASSINYYCVNPKLLITKYFASGYTTSNMLKIWTFCGCKLCAACACSDDHLLSNCLPYWKGNVSQLKLMGIL